MKILITESQKKRIMNKETKWEEINGRLIRTFYFGKYDEVMDFVYGTMEIAKKQNHHPDIVIHYDNVKLSITDHEKGKVSEKCHKFATAVDKLY